MIAHFKSKQFIIFLITGGLAAVVNFSSRIIYNLWFTFSTSVILAYVSGMITAFILAKIFVFTDSKQSLKKSALYFLLVNIIAIFQTWVISIALAYYVFPCIGVDLYPKALAHAIGVVIPVFTSYLGHKQFSFK